MRWQTGRRSSNIVDRRGSPGGRRGVSLGIGGTVVVALIAWALGADPIQVLQQLDTAGPPAPGTAPPPSAEENRAADFVSAVLADTEDTWPLLLQPVSATYEQPKLVLFRDGVDSDCGFASSAVGPFYCPGDR